MSEQLQSTLAYPKGEEAQKKLFNSFHTFRPLGQEPLVFQLRRSEMMHLHDDDHVHWQRIMQHEDGVLSKHGPFDILHLVLALLCTQKQKKSVFVLSFSLQLGSTRPDRQPLKTPS